MLLYQLLRHAIKTEAITRYAFNQIIKEHTYKLNMYA